MIILFVLYALFCQYFTFASIEIPDTSYYDVIEEKTDSSHEILCEKFEFFIYYVLDPRRHGLLGEKARHLQKILIDVRSVLLDSKLRQGTTKMALNLLLTCLILRNSSLTPFSDISCSANCLMIRLKTYILLTL